jgi:gluconolactonase
MKIAALWATACLLSSFAADYSLGPDSQPQPDVPKGAVTKHVLKPGKYFPGTPHNYSLYVPAQYDKSKPMAFMIFLDGNGALGNATRANVVFDNLIHKKELPPMIGIFVDPGVLPPVSEGAQSRFERVFEYDSLSPRFSNFLIDELIPEVSKSFHLSSNPNDRGIYGVSTGAVGALVAAWHRPDQFRRVLSFIGTFVAMKGADGFAALIRRSEAKPLRVYLQAGRNDHIAPNQPYGTFYAGSWPVNNQVMHEALQFAGYDVRFDLGEEAHNMKHGSAVLPDALRWLWRGYPEPIAVREPAALGAEGWDPRGKVSSIVSATSTWESVSEKEANPLPSNTRVKTGNGNTYFVDIASKRIGRVDPKGRTQHFAHELAAPSGIALSPDEAMVVVTDSTARFSWSFQIDEKGDLVNGEPFYRLEVPESGWRSGVMAATFDSIGQVYFATALGIQMCEANGRVAALLHSPEVRSGLTAVAFGGPGMSTLYVRTESGKLYRRAVKVQGVAGKSKLPRPPL